jgi:hypothetical protein
MTLTMCTKLRSHVGLFDINLDVVFVVNDQRVKAKAQFEDQMQVSISVTLEAAPSCIEIDPLMKVLFDLDFNPGVDLLKGTLVGASNVRSRTFSAKQLVKVGGKRDTELQKASERKRGRIALCRPSDIGTVEHQIDWNRRGHQASARGHKERTVLGRAR